MHATRPDQRGEPNLATETIENGGLPMAINVALVQVVFAGALSPGLFFLNVSSARCHALSMYTAPSGP